MKSPLLSLSNISKSFGTVNVLTDITLEAHSGEILALVGENGAGKSTLMKIISGVWPHKSFSGTLKILGREVVFSSPQDSEKEGISIIHQELNLIPELSVAENIFLGRLPHQKGILNWNKLFKNAQNILDELQVPFSPQTQVKSLSIGQKQMVEIAKALSLKSQILILDEPTSALTQKEIQKLFQILRKLKNDGVLCVYISHKLSEVFEISDKIYILRDGKLVSYYETREVQLDQIISDMVGRQIPEMDSSRINIFGKKVLEVKNLTCIDRNGKTILKDISFFVREGEILGIAGLMGSGRSELVTPLFGAAPYHINGDITLLDQKFTPLSPRHAIQLGLALLTEDRKLSGMIPYRSVRENMTLSSLRKLSHRKVIHHMQEKNVVGNLMKQFKIKTPTSQLEIRHLSGGNQQKALLAKWCLLNPKIIFLDEPTRGVDIGSKTEIYHFMNELSKKGVAIVLISSDLPEVLKMSDRIAVLNQGQLKDVLDKTVATQEKIMRLATC